MNIKLKEIRSKLGGRVSSVNAYDANAARQIVSKFEAPPADTSRLVVTIDARKINVFANEKLGSVCIGGNFELPNFTINAPDRMGFKSVSAGVFKIGASEYAVFTRNGSLAVSQVDILKLAELVKLTEYHRFRKGDALHFYRNGLILYVREEDLSSELVFLLLALAARIPAVDTKSIEIELPPGFAHLQNISQYWAIGDDMEREDRIAKASGKQLKDFLATVEPDLPAIYSYLEQFEGDVPNDGTAHLAQLIETVREVENTLARRQLLS